MVSDSRPSDRWCVVANQLETGLAWLSDQRRAHMSRTITYVRGNSSVELVATAGRSRFQQIDSGRGAALRVHAHDFILSVAELVIDGDATLPRPGDQVRTVIDGVEHVFTVAPFAGGPCYEFTDASRRTVRVHTKHTGSESA